MATAAPLVRHDAAIVVAFPYDGLLLEFLMDDSWEIDPYDKKKGNSINGFDRPQKLS